MGKVILLLSVLVFTAFADESIPVSFESSPAKADACLLDSTQKAISNDVVRMANKAIAISDRLERGKSCKFYNKFLDKGVPKAALKQALHFFEENKKSFSNKNYITIADYSQNSSKSRFFLLDLRTGKVTKEKVSHGSGSLSGVKYADATINKGRVTRASSHNGMMKRCRIPKSKVGVKHDQWALTRPGFFKTENFYMSVSHDERVKGTKGWPSFKVEGRTYNGMRLTGLSDGVNDKAYSQGVVMHEAYYNRGKIMGRSFGCPAFVPKKGRGIMEKISKGSLYYSYVPIEGCEDDYSKVLESVHDWETMCE